MYVTAATGRQPICSKQINNNNNNNNNNNSYEVKVQTKASSPISKVFRTLSKVSEWMGWQYHKSIGEVSVRLKLELNKEYPRINI